MITHHAFVCILINAYQHKLKGAPPPSSSSSSSSSPSSSSSSSPSSSSPSSPQPPPPQVFDYYNVINNTGFHNHFPVQEMVCSAKLRYTHSPIHTNALVLTYCPPHYSSVCYNPYHKSTLASSDYDGCVCVWDTGSGKRVVTHQVLSRSQTGRHTTYSSF